ncbi:hypothetical protein AcW1_005578 [Taiwanofungus camphoratus]|nr:hypothetical protein AcW1_005578 [Antrodia cinnamomea]
MVQYFPTYRRRPRSREGSDVGTNRRSSLRLGHHCGSRTCSHFTGSSHPKGGATGVFSPGPLKHSPCVSRTFAGGDRLTSSSPYPAANACHAALLDTVPQYHDLLRTIGFRAEKVIFSDDSPGGHLSLALSYYPAMSQLRDIPVPDGLFLCHPQ